MNKKKISKDELLVFLRKEKNYIKKKYGIEILALFGSMEYYKYLFRTIKKNNDRNFKKRI